jgi:tetratricopeptide (TPR) repeat protein
LTKHVVFWGLCAVLVFVPLPIGSVEEWAVFVFEAATIGLFLLYLGGEMAARAGRGRGRVSIEDGEPLFPDAATADGSGRPDAPARLPLFFKVLLGVFLFVSVLQLVPLPPAVVKVLSPRAYDIFTGLSRDGISAPAGRLTLSLAPSASLGELVLILCYGIFGFLVLRTVRSRRQVEAFVLVILASALFQALYGMVEMFSGHEMIFGRVKRFGTGSVTGTYVNRNHFAGFLEMAFPLSLGYLLVKARYFAMEKGLSLRRRILWFSQESLQWTLLLGLVPVFIGVGLVFSKSRSGILIFVVTAVLAAAAAASWREFSESDGEWGEKGERAGGAHPSRPRQGRTVRLVVMVVLAAAVWLGVGPVIERFSEVDISGEARRLFYANTVRMIGDFPLAGTGKGTYVNAYAIYEPVDDRLRLSFAHNDYLEFAAENGIVAGAALALAGVGLAVWLAAMWRRRRGGFAKGIGLGAALGVTAILIHGFTDFNLQITANAVYFTALAMLGVAVLTGRGDMYPGSGYVSPFFGLRGEGQEGDQEGIKERGHVQRAHVRKRRLGPPAAVLAALVLFVPAWRDFRGFHHLEKYRMARGAARSVESAFPALEARLEKAVASSPRAVFRVELARLYTEMARVANDSGREEDREAFCDKAVAAYDKAIAANPIDAFTHYEAGTVYLLYNFPLMTYADRAKAYFRKALELKPADEFINLNVIFVYFSGWPGLEDAEKAYAAGLYRAMLGRDPAFAAKLEARWKQSFGSAAALKAVLAALPSAQ